MIDSVLFSDVSVSVSTYMIDPRAGMLPRPVYVPYKNHLSMPTDQVLVLVDFGLVSHANVFISRPGYFSETGNVTCLWNTNPCFS